MSFVKYRLKEVAADFGVAPKQIAQIMEQFLTVDGKVLFIQMERE